MENLEIMKESVRMLLKNLVHNSNFRDYSFYRDWHIQASREIQRRESLRLNFLSNLSIQELKAVTTGKLNIAELAAEIYKNYGYED